jgi:hypothetical protein
MDNRLAVSADQRHLFIGGLHRSGTSLLHATLRAHSEISGFAGTGAPEDEGQHLQTVFPIGLAFGGPGRFGFDPRAYMDENHPLATPASAAMLAAEWGRYWDLTKPVLIEKTPLNLIRMRFFQKLFPDARFILLLRHPVVVAYATWKFTGLPIHMLIEHGLRCYECALADVPALSHFHRVHYEELMAAPQPTIDRIVRFAGVGDFKIGDSLARDSNPAYFAQWQRERTHVLAIAESEQPGWLARTVARCWALGYTLDSPGWVGRN